MPINYKRKKAEDLEEIDIDVSGSSSSSEDEAEDLAANEARAEALLAVDPSSVPAHMLITHLHDAQVLVGVLQELVKRYRHKEDAKRKTPNVCSKCGTKTKPKLVPPEELADLEDEIAYVGRVYSLLICLWPPKEAFVMGARPEGVNPEDYAQRYPKYGDRVQALINARIAEFVDFLPPEFVQWIRNKWWKSVIARGINTHKCHIVANVKAVRGEIFKHVPDLESRLEFWRGADGELFAPIFYPNGDTSQKHHVFRHSVVLNTLMVMNYGRGALSRTQPPSSNTTAKSYGVESVTNGMAAAAFVLILFLLSGSSTFRPSDWQPRFHEFVKFLMKKRETLAIKRLMAHLNHHLFSVPGGRTEVTPLALTDGDSDDEDWSALDDEFAESAITARLRPLRHQRDIRGASAVLRRARVEAVSRAMTASVFASAAALARRRPGSEYDPEGPDTPPTRLHTPEGVDMSVVSRAPHDAESISVAKSRIQASASLPDDREVLPSEPARAAPVVPMGPPPVPAHAAPAPNSAEQAAVVPDAQAKAPRQRRGAAAKASTNAQPVPPVPAPIPDAPAKAPHQRRGAAAKASTNAQPVPAVPAPIPDAPAKAPRQRRGAAAKASTNAQPVPAVPAPIPDAPAKAPRQRRGAAAKPSTSAGLAPVPEADADADAVKPTQKQKPKPRPVKKSVLKGGRKGKAAAVEEELAAVGDENEGEDENEDEDEDEDEEPARTLRSRSGTSRRQ